MFKSKVDFNVFDKNNTKVKDLEQTKAKALSKAGVKKLQSSPETSTTFHLALNYFKDDKDNSLGHFIGFGENKKLDKHFQQVEMKSGKMDKSMTASPKEASLGTAYVKTINGKETLCFEPDANSKIPQGKWPKILKELKAWFSGIKTVAIFNGQVIEEEGGEEEGDNTTNTTEEETSDTTQETSQEEPSTDEREEEVIQKGKQKLAGQLGKMDQGVQQMNEAVGKAPKVKLMGNVEKYEKALADLIKKANEDNIVDEEEQAEIDAMTQKIAELKQNIEENGGALTAEKRQKVNDNLATIRGELEKMMAEFG